MRFRFFALPIAIAALILASPARAGLVSYGDFASWSASVPVRTSVSIPEPASAFDYFGTGDASVSYGGVLFSTNSALGNGSFFNVGAGFSGSPAVLSSQQQTNGLANILITLPSPVTALALNFGTFDGSIVNFKLSNGTSLNLAGSNTAYEVSSFFGVASSSSFNSILLTTADSALNINDLLFGTAVPAIPEPSTWLLMLVGFAGMVSVSRPRKTRMLRTS